MSTRVPQNRRADMLGVEYSSEEGFLFPNRSDADLRQTALMRHHAVEFAVLHAKWRHRLTSWKEYIGGTAGVPPRQCYVGT